MHRRKKSDTAIVYFTLYICRCEDKIHKLMSEKKSPSLNIFEMPQFSEIQVSVWNFKFKNPWYCSLSVERAEYTETDISTLFYYSIDSQGYIIILLYNR